MMEMLSNWTQFPTEVFALAIAVLTYVLRVMNKRCVTVADMLRFEIKMGKLMQREGEKARADMKEIREEFELKLQNLREELRD